MRSQTIFPQPEFVMVVVIKNHPHGQHKQHWHDGALQKTMFGILHEYQVTKYRAHYKSLTEQPVSFRQLAVYSRLSSTR